MDRPLFFVGSAFLWSLMLLSLTGETLAIILGTVNLAAFLISVFLRRRSIVPAVCIAVAVSCLLFVCKTEFEYKPQAELVGTNRHFEGYVTRIIKDSVSGSHRYIVDTKSGKVRLSSKDLEASVADYLSWDGSTVLVDDKPNEVYIGSYTFNEIEITDLKHAPISGFDRLKCKVLLYVDGARKYIEGVVEETLPSPYSYVCDGILIGDKSKIEDEKTDAFKRSGVSHLFAVSGFHTSLWSMIIYKGLRKRGIGQTGSAIAAILFILWFIGVTGFSKSAIRAGVMLIIFFAGYLLNREPDSLNSLGCAALLITALNPFSGGDVGLLLSYFATLGLLAVYPLLSRPLHKRLQSIGNYRIRSSVESIIGIVLMSLCTTITTLPIMMLWFGNISVISPLTNLLVVSISSLAIMFSGIGVVLSLIPIISIFKYPLFMASGLIIKYVLFVCEKLSSIPFSYIGINDDYLKITLAAVLTLIAVSLVLYNAKIPIKLVSILSVIILLASVLSNNMLESKVVTVSFPDVGNGSTVVVCFEGSAAIIGCGGDYRVENAIADILAANHVNRVNVLIVPNDKETESGAAEKIIERFSPETTIFGEEGDADIKLFPGVELSLDNPIAILNIGDFKTLFVFLPTVDLSNLTENGQSFDAIFSRASWPLGLNYDDFSVIIVSGDNCGAELRVKSNRYSLRRLKT